MSVERVGLGRWVQSGVPHRGWTCTGIEDLGHAEAVCQMCETVTIRYVHIMQHADYPDRLNCGCICAGHMEEDVVGARRRESDFRNRQKRRENWLNSASWRVSANGNQYRTFKGFLVVVFPRSDGWSGQIKDIASERVINAKHHYSTVDAAKLAALDGVLWCVDHWKDLDPWRGRLLTPRTRRATW